MFDISWTEFLLIGVVALIVIGPKELPGVLRTLGQWTRKVRGMAADFQNQFQEAMREAEMVDLKKQVDDMAQDFKSYDPLKGVRDDVNAMGKDIERSIERPSEPKPTATGEPAAAPEANASAPGGTSETSDGALPAAEAAVHSGPVERGDLEPVSADGAAPASEPAASGSEPDNTGRSG